MTENANILTTPSVTPSRHQVVALAYDGLCTFEFGVAVEIFGLPRPEMGDNWYQFAVAAVDEGPLCAEHAERHLIVCHHYGADPRLQVEELESFLPAAGGAPVAKHR
ncbi:hypothetical protein PXW85_24330, partial [Klebsiella pneumoniae]|nr:hypothetical protein [Klebsiella pneumoniae]